MMQYSSKWSGKSWRRAAALVSGGSLVAALLGAPAWAQGGLEASLLGPLAKAAPVADAVLAQLRGGYVPPGSSGQLAQAAMLRTEGNPPMQPLESSIGNTQLETPPGLSGLGLGGSVTGLVVQLESQWKTGLNGADAAMVGANLGILLGKTGPQVTIDHWSSTTGNGLSNVSNDGGVVQTGNALGSLSGGVGQSIQIAGDGNSVTNQASVDVTSSGAPPILPPSGPNTGCPQCSVTVGGNTLGVQIATPGGLVSQSIGGNGILQNTQLMSNVNQIINTMNVQVQVDPSTTLTSTQISSLLQTITGLGLHH